MTAATPEQPASQTLQEQVENQRARLQKETAKRKRMEKALRASEEKYRTLVENINDVIFSVDIEGCFTYISPAIEQFTRYKASQIIGQPFTRFVHPDDLPGLMNSFQRTLAGGLEPCEFRAFNSNGEAQYVRTSSRPLWKGNRLVGLTGIMTDITNRKRVEAALQQAHDVLEQRVQERTAELYQANRLLAMLSECNQALVRAAQESILLQEICQLVVEKGGYPLAWVSLVDPSDPHALTPVARASLEGESLDILDTSPAGLKSGPFSSAIRSRQPSIYRDIQNEPFSIPWKDAISLSGYSSCASFPLFTGKHILGTLNVFSKAPNSFQPPEVEVLTELADDLGFGMASLRERAARREMEEGLRDSEEKFRSFVESSSDGYSLVNEQGSIIEWNPAAARISGIPADQAMGKPIWEVQFQTHEPARQSPEIFQRQKAAVLDALRTGQSPLFDHIIETSLLRPDGTVHSIHQILFPIQTALGYRIGAITRDVTERRRAEDALKEAHKQLKRSLIFNEALLSAIPTPVFYMDKEGRYLGCNQAFSDFTGVDPDQVKGKTVVDLWPGENAQAYYQKDLDLIRRPEQQFYEFKVQDKEGADRPVIFAKNVFRDENGQVAGIVGAFLDITTRKEAETIREALYSISQAVISTEKLDDLYRCIHQILGSLMPASNFFIALYDPVTDLLNYPYYVDQFDTVPAPERPGRGMTGYVLRTGNPVLVSPEEFKALVRQGEVDLVGAPSIDWIGVPLKVENRTIGIMAVQSYTEHVRYGERELNIMEFVSTQVAMAIERKRSFDEIRLHVQRLSALHSIDMAITSSFDLRLNLGILLEQVLTQLSVDAADILLLDPSTFTLEYAVGRGFRTLLSTDAKVRLGESFAGHVALDRHLKPLELPAEIQKRPRFAAFWAAEGFSSYYAVPLIAKGQVKGVMEIFHRAPLAIAPEWINFLETLSGQAAISIENSQLFDHLQRSNADLILAYDATIAGWSKALDLRDQATEGHTLRVTELTVKLARAVGIPDHELIHVRRGTLLHDIGKMAIPDSILLKPGSLTPEEQVIMHMHPKYAYEMLSSIAYLHPALDIPYCHHERWDGSGYPLGLEAEQIPLPARVFAVIDVWDALNSDRPYRKAWSRKDALSHIRAEAGRHFDPRIVETFLSLKLMDTD